jgi:ATP-dependent helicase HepA
MRNFIIGQRYISLAEPELGLGIVTSVQDKTLVVTYPAADEMRNYSQFSAPLKRVVFEKGDNVTSIEGTSFVVEEVYESESGLIVYLGATDQEIIPESELDDSTSFHHPEGKLFNATSDSLELFNLRERTFFHNHYLSTHKCKGLVGGRIGLIPHQFYMAQRIVQSSIPRAILADEVGLGKTIQAGLILHKLLLAQRIKRSLIVVPNGLTYQWFVEMLKKFNLSFMVINEQTNLEAQSNPFEENDLVIVSLQLFNGSEVAREMITNAQWDFLVVDEAHKIRSKKESTNLGYENISNLAKNIKGLLLITATPLIYGLEEHFGQLQLIDHERFYDYNEFQNEHHLYGQYADIAKKLNSSQSSPLTKEEVDFLNTHNIPTDVESKQILNHLQERHGTGRILYRNTRKGIEQYMKSFPKRILRDHILTSEKIDNNSFFDFHEDFTHDFKSLSFELKTKWLFKYLEKNHEHKTLLICHSKEMVIEIEKQISKNSIHNKCALFHSDLSLIARDRQAAYFADPQGANLLLCTEIGSEGRNFEFAHQLILFDLPQNPDLLEQRIGRLDRIGQSEDIQIHVPYLKNSWEEVLYRSYNEGINAFCETAKGGHFVFEEHREKIMHFLMNAKEGMGNDFDQLILKLQATYKKTRDELEAGRDILVEINSFNEEEALLIVEEVQLLDQSEELKKYLEEIFTQFGVDVDDINETSQFIRPGDNMYIPVFPGLPRDGMSITYSREVALKREDLSFMTWDHPLVIGIMEIIMGSDVGNMCVATRKKAPKKSKSYFEIYFSLSAKAEKELELGKYLPPTYIRTLMDIELQDLSNKWDKENIDNLIHEAPREVVLRGSKAKKSLVKDIIQAANQCATTKSQSVKLNAIEKIKEELDFEINRLKYLKQINNLISNREIEYLEQKKNLLVDIVASATIGLDSIRAIL